MPHNEELKKIEQTASLEIEKSNTSQELELARVAHLGRSAPLMLFLRGLKDLPVDRRAIVGGAANAVKQNLESAFKTKKNLLDERELARQLTSESIDVTVPGKKISRGHLHPLTIVRREIEQIFASIGFSVVEGPEIETEWYNFDALNIPSDHPSRDMHDTFWLSQNPSIAKDTKKHLLPRTHVSSMQVRYMENHQPPFRLIMPGRVFRNEATDATHEMQFTYLEGMMVDKNISVANLKGVVEYFFKKFFKGGIEVKFVSSFFPFTEPSLEVLIKPKDGAFKNRWLEVAGAGMIHQNVFKNAGYAPREWQGFAFGFGIDRLALLRYKIDDIRLLYGSDIRFLNQF